MSRARKIAIAAVTVALALLLGALVGMVMAALVAEQKCQQRHMTLGQQDGAPACVAIQPKEK